VPLVPLVLRSRAEPSPVVLVDGNVVDAGLAPPHQAVLVELPQLVAVAAVPLVAVVVPLVLEADGDAVLAEVPQALAQRVVELLLPLGGEEVDNLGAAADEGVAVPPDRLFGVGQRDPVWISGVPGVFGGLDLHAGGRQVEGRERRARIGHRVSFRTASRTGGHEAVARPEVFETPTF
jgi:hypothetical protein